MQRRPFAFDIDSAASRAGNEFISSQDEDSDEWLDVNASDFDALLKQTSSQPLDADKNVPQSGTDFGSGSAVGDTEDRVATQQAERLQRMAQKIENFVQGEGDLEGALFEEYVGTKNNNHGG